MDAMVPTPAQDLFSYAQLSREDEVSAREDAAIIRAHTESAARSIIIAGQALIRQKERLPHGMFHKWIEAEFSMSDRTASRFMLRAERWTKLANLADLTPQIASSVLDEVTDPSTPTEVRDKVEQLLVDGATVTVADIRRYKKEAAEAQSAIKGLEARNAELSAPKGKKKTKEVDVDAIREAIEEEAIERGRAEAEKDFQKEKHDLTNQLVAANAELRELREEMGRNVEAENIVRPVFGADMIDPELEHDDEFITEDDAIAAFIMAVRSVSSLTIPPAAFWKAMGPKRGTHSKKAHEALLAINTTIGALIKEHSK